MSTPDARLSAAERAALADLESAALAADPHWAARLRGRAPSRLSPVLHSGRARARRAWAWLLGRRWWGAPTVAAGLVLTVAGLSVGVVVSVIGVALCALGLRILAEIADQRFFQGPWPQHRSSPSPPQG